MVNATVHFFGIRMDNSFILGRLFFCQGLFHILVEFSQSANYVYPQILILSFCTIAFRSCDALFSIEHYDRILDGLYRFILRISCGCSSYPENLRVACGPLMKLFRIE